ncbi:conserved hypothetical protein [Ricinus communis]|uniref:Uncharacterized protein n=1 Tax=Ricinus communis TaxID=3988 RepID=B9RXZ8_RICCO|nr:conserved hypothetical protein [Ricinus communis]
MVVVRMIKRNIEVKRKRDGWSRNASLSLSTTKRTSGTVVSSELDEFRWEEKEERHKKEGENCMFWHCIFHIAVVGL